MADKQNKQSRRFIIVFVICSLLVIISELVISQNISSDFSRLMQEQRRNSVSKMAHLAYNTIRPTLDEYHTGKIDSSAARERIADLVRNMTYEDEYGKNYIFMSSYAGTMLVQPFEPRKEGTNQWNLQDPNGKYIIRELAKAAREKPNGSFVSYNYYLPKKDRIEEKLSYVMGIPEIDAYIGTGMYMQSSYKDLKKVLEIQRYGFIFMTIFILVGATIHFRGLIRANRFLFNEIRDRKYAENNIRTVFDSIHDTIIIHDKSGRIFLTNERANELYGIPENQIMNYNIKDLSVNDPKEILNQTDFLKNSSLVFEWKCRCPLNNTVFDGEVALRLTEWSGKEVIVAVVRDISERKKQEEEIRHLAYYDYLTSLHNRVFIMNALKKELKDWRLKTVNGAVIFIDLDNFKNINDSFGHFFGDEVLIQLANRLKKLQSEVFLPSRIGGDEFVILCVSASLSETIEIAEKILDIFRDPISLHDNIINITCSIGIALYPKDGNSVNEIFKNADMALYSAKYQGKDSYVFYEDVMSKEMQYKTEMERQLRQAYDNKEFVLYYQPLYDVEKKQITGYEALIRWNSEKYGVVSPDRIIPLAEEIGLIDKIEKWVIESTFAFAEYIQSLERDDLYISCNVSPAQLADRNFVKNIFRLFKRYHLKEGSVAFEITETCLIDSFPEASRKLSLLRRKGIRIFLDDFGTGYSSLNYLKNLPVDYIKIDKSFIDNITNSGMDSRILKTIITLAHEMEIRTVAEGVETEEQYEYLKSCKCDMVQGFLFSKPRPEEEIKRSIK